MTRVEHMVRLDVSIVAGSVTSDAGAAERHTRSSVWLPKQTALGASAASLPIPPSDFSGVPGEYTQAPNPTISNPRSIGRHPSPGWWSRRNCSRCHLLAEQARVRAVSTTCSYDNSHGELP